MLESGEVLGEAADLPACSNSPCTAKPAVNNSVESHAGAENQAVRGHLISGAI